MQVRPGGRLERRKARTRAAILEAATALFREQGYDETSIQQIAEAADTGVGTLYGYFRAKEEILRAVMNARWLQYADRYRAAADGQTSAIDRLCAVMEQHARFVSENRGILLAAFEVVATRGNPEDQPGHELYEDCCRWIQAGVDSGEIRPLPVDMTTRIILDSYTMAMLGILLFRGREDDPQTLTDLETVTRRLLTKE